MESWHQVRVTNITQPRPGFVREDDLHGQPRQEVDCGGYSH
jgi:hypothetical protein